jgi:hypothetical protein
MPLQVCEYMNGGTLSQIVREQGRQNLGETVRVISAMCAALAEAHQLGIVHRDIKPQNILFGSVGANRLPKLADFGIAKWSVDDDAVKEKIAEDTAIVAGQKLAMYSPSWAAPEQLAGQSVSPATDIYSLATVAIYMLSTRAIFADEDVYAGYKKRRHADEHVRDALQSLGIPRAVSEVLSRALAFDPKKRLSKVDELAGELATSLEPSTEQIRRVTPPRGVAAAEPATPTSPHSAVTPVGQAARAHRDSNTGITDPLGRVPDAPPLPPAPPPPPATDPTPATYHAPAAQAWMSYAPAPGGAAHRLALADGPLPHGDRRLHFVMAATQSADLAGPHGTKVRVTLVPGPTGQRVVHLKGLTCFVAHVGGRPSPAVQLDHSADIALVTPRAQEIAHLRVSQGSPGMGQVVFAIGSELAAVAVDDCADPILFDFGPGSDAYFVYTRGRTLPKSGRRG